MRATAIVQEDVDRILAGVDFRRFDGKTVVITGAAGFLGFTFAHAFAAAIERGAKPRAVELLDSFLLGEPAWLQALAKQHPRLRARRFDVARDRLGDVGLERAEYVVHMASVASPTFYRKYPVETLDANVWGLRNLLDHARGGGLEGLLFFSSSEVYGDPDPAHIPTSEDYRGNVSALGPRACYDEAKRFGETLCYVYATTHGLPITVVRPFNNYGPGMGTHDRRAPADFARAVMEGKDLVLHSDGRPTRTFCYVADAVEGYLRALLHGRFDVFNIGMDRPEVSVAEFAELFRASGEALLGYRGRVRLEPSTDAEYLTNNPSRRCPDIAKARELLGFQPRAEVAEGVRRYLAHLAEEAKV